MGTAQNGAGRTREQTGLSHVASQASGCWARYSVTSRDFALSSPSFVPTGS